MDHCELDFLMVGGLFCNIISRLTLDLYHINGILNLLSMKMKYESPKIDVIDLKMTGIICTSGEGFSGNTNDAIKNDEFFPDYFTY